MSPRPYVLLSVATALDGYIDDSSSRRLLLSNGEDLDRVDAVRASVDAIAVGANTIRNDNPRLPVQSESRRRRRLDTGLGATPIKVTFSVTGDLAAHFFTTGEIDKLVYTPTSRQEPLIEKLGRVATVVDAGEPLSLATVLADLAYRKVRRFMVEGAVRCTHCSSALTSSTNYSSSTRRSSSATRPLRDSCAPRRFRRTRRGR